MTEMWNATTGTVYLKASEQVKVANFRSFFPGLEMIGKHFKVRAFNSVNFDAESGEQKF